MKKSVKQIGILVFIYSLFIAYCNAQWQLTSCNTGKYPGNCINCIAASEPNIFVGTDGNGIFLSTNNGLTWAAMNKGLAHPIVNTLAISGVNIFAGTDYGVYLSTNNGTSWAGVNNWMTLNGIEVFAISGKNIFIGTDASGVLLSTNNGASWDTMNNGIPPIHAVFSLVISGSNIFAGVNGKGGGVFLSTDNGSSWKPMSKGLTDSTDVWALDTSGTNIFAGTYLAGVFLSTNNGASWSAVNNGLTDTLILTLIISGVNIFVGTVEGGVFLSSDNGANWMAVNNGLDYSSGVSALVISEDTLFAGTEAGVVWKRALSEMVGIHEFSIQHSAFSIQIYPNPAINYITIETSPNLTHSPGLKKYILTIRNIQGQELLSGNISFVNTYKLDLTNLTNGIYFLTLQNNQENFVNKLVIQK